MNVVINECSYSMQAERAVPAPHFFYNNRVLTSALAIRGTSWTGLS